MNPPRLLVCGLAAIVSVFGAEDTPKLSVPGASPEAMALYQFLLDNTGQHTLSGQHGAPLTGTRGCRVCTTALGPFILARHTPALRTTPLDRGESNLRSQSPLYEEGCPNGRGVLDT